MTPDGALQLLTAINSNTHSEIVRLDLSHITVTYEFGALYLDVLQHRPHLTVSHGGYVRVRTPIALSRYASCFLSRAIDILVLAVLNFSTRIY